MNKRVTKTIHLFFSEMSACLSVGVTCIKHFFSVSDILQQQATDANNSTTTATTTTAETNNLTTTNARSFWLLHSKRSDELFLNMKRSLELISVAQFVIRWLWVRIQPLNRKIT